MNPPESRTRRITHNTLFLYGAEAAARLFSWAMLVFLTRRWTEVGTYGQYAIAVNWVSILAVFSELGLNVLVVREVAHRKDQALFYLRNAILIRSLFSFACLAFLTAISFVLGYEPVLKAGMAIMGLRILLDSISGGYVYMFQSHEMMGYYSLVNVLSSAIRLAGIVAVVEMGGGVVGACAVWTVASLIALVALVWKGRQLGWRVDFSRFQVREAWPVLRQSIPLATFGTLQMLYYRIDSVILKSLSGNEMVGYYDLAAKLLFVVLSFSQIFGTAVFPVFSSLRDDVQAFGRMAARTFKFLLLLGLPAAAGGFLLSRPLVFLVSGSKYQPSAPMLAVLMLSVAPYFLSHVYVIALAVYDAFRLNLQFALLFLLNAALNFILIPRMGGMGSAWATTGCEFFGLAMGFWLAGPYLVKLPWLNLLRPLGAALGAVVLMGVGIRYDPRLYWLALGPLVYGLGLVALGGLDREDRARIRSVFNRRNPASLWMDPDRPYLFKSPLKRRAFQLADAVGSRLLSAPRREVDWKDVKRIAILRLDHLGDVLLALPALEALVRTLPEAQIDFFIGPWSKPLADISGLKINSTVFRAPWFDKKRTLKWSSGAVRDLEDLLRKGHYDVAIDLRGDFRHLIAMGRSAIRNRIACPRTGFGFTLTKPVAYLPAAHEMDQNLNLLEGAGLGLADKPRFPRLYPGEGDGNAQREVRQRLGLSQPTIALHAICANPAKRWPVENWRRLIDGLPESMDAVLVGTEEEKAGMEEILKGCRRKVYLTAGLLNLAALAAFLKESRLFIGVDSGPAHIAAAVGAQVVSLYSGTNVAGQWGPRGPKVQILQKTPPCSPCERTECPFDNECMRQITVEEVLDAVKHSLELKG